MSMILYYRRAASVGLLLVALLVSCGMQPQVPPHATPTMSSMFGTQPTIRPVATFTDASNDSSFPQPTANPTNVAQATITALGENKLVVVPVYDDALSVGWSLTNSFQTIINLEDRSHVASGHFAIKAQPKFNTGTVYFTLDKTVVKGISRHKVQALRFYISGGDNPIDKDAMTVAIVGSNVYPYWVKDDTSVKIYGRVTDGQPVFSETRLSFLGINKSVPPKTYVKVTVWLNDLIYDPLYTYVTGFYFKTDKISVPTFYIDDVSLLMQPDFL